MSEPLESSVRAHAERQRYVRRQVLALLYDARLERKGAAMYPSQIAQQLAIPAADVSFACDVLAETGFIQASGAAFTLTARGAIEIETLIDKE